MSRLGKLFGSCKTRPVARQARLGLEAFDQRLVPSVTFTEDTGAHSLSMTAGAGQNNTVTIRNDGDGNLRVTADGVTRTFTHVRHVTVDTGYGKDTVTYNQGVAGSEADTRRSFDLNVYLGNNDDRFTANVFGDVGFRQDGVMQARELSLKVYGGDGNDRIDFNLHDTDVGTGSTLTIDAEESYGLNNVTVDMDGEVDGKLAITAAGGRDLDTIAVNVRLAADSSGSFKGVVTGWYGDDALQFAVRQAAGSHADVDALLDGGFELFLPEHDVGRHTANVRTAWLEQDIPIQ